jgi:hypothetical protein
MGRMTIVATAAKVGWAARRQWRAIPQNRRQRLEALLRQSGGWPANLSAAERRELWTLVQELNLGEVLRQGATRSASRRRGE